MPAGRCNGLFRRLGSGWNHAWHMPRCGTLTIWECTCTTWLACSHMSCAMPSASQGKKRGGHMSLHCYQAACLTRATGLPTLESSCCIAPGRVWRCVRVGGGTDSAPSVKSKRLFLLLVSVLNGPMPAMFLQLLQEQVVHLPIWLPGKARHGVCHQGRSRFRIPISRLPTQQQLGQANCYCSFGHSPLPANSACHHDPVMRPVQHLLAMVDSCPVLSLAVWAMPPKAKICWRQLGCAQPSGGFSRRRN